MANLPEPMEIYCDAPPYAVVRACHQLGFENPLDVRWCRMRQFRKEAQHHGVAQALSWKVFFNFAAQKGQTCTCGHALPSLESCSFLFASGRRERYLIGQCPKCRTIFWEEEGML